MRQDRNWTHGGIGRAQLEAGQEARASELSWKDLIPLFKVKRRTPKWGMNQSTHFPDASLNPSGYVTQKAMATCTVRPRALSSHLGFLMSSRYWLCSLGKARGLSRGNWGWGMQGFYGCQWPKREFIQLDTWPWELHLKKKNYQVCC